MKDDGLKGVAIASVVCGIGSWFILGIVLAPLGVVLGVMGMKSQDSSTKTWATVGMVVSIVALSLLLFSFAILAGAR